MSMSSEAIESAPLCSNISTTDISCLHCDTQSAPLCSNVNTTDISCLHCGTQSAPLCSNINTTDISCLHCGIHFTAKQSLYRHMRNFHASEKFDLPAGKVCGICMDKCRTISDLQGHINSHHPHVGLIFEKKVFYEMKDFEEWKSQIEIQTQSHFVNYYSNKRLADDRVVSYYNCHRSGEFKPKGKGHRGVKCAGSNKIGSTCPANIKVYDQMIDDIREIQVEYQSTHVGHTLEIRRISLTATERNWLADQMKQGIPKSAVLHNLQKSYSPTKRLSLIRRKDLHNICRDYKINQETVLHQNNAISVDMSVKKMQNEDNSILIYKPIDEVLHKHPAISKDEFLLAVMNDAQLKLLELHSDVIMIDSTYGTNRHGFHLTTIMVNDGNDEGFPVAILYSTKVTTETFVAFFSEVKKHTINLKPKVFMSDDAPALYNAWKIVFGEVDHNLICTWHVRRAWNTNLNSKIKDSNVRAIVRRELNQIHHETDVIAFELVSDTFISKLLSNDDTRAFGEYFTAHYMDRVKQWAYCYRLKLAVNINMKLESWHRELKEAGALIIKRLDKSLNLMLSIITKKLIGRIVSLERHKLTSQIIEIHKRHDKSKSMSAESVVEMEPHKSWVVSFSRIEASTMIFETYDVLFQSDCDCDIRCQDCNICIHQFQCTCLDYRIHLQICKHIHLVCQHFSFGTSRSNSSSHENNILELEIDFGDDKKDERAAITNEINKNISISDIEQQRMVLLSEFQTLLAKTESVEQLTVLREAMSVGKARFAAVPENRKRMPVVQKHVTSQPANKRIKSQRRFIPTSKLNKRKRTEEI